MKAFVSYSTRQKRRAAAVKRALLAIGIDSFLAHETLQVSEEWQRRILQELRTCTIFIPLLSKAFKASAWCGQEVGIVSRRRGVLIMPFSLDGTTPYGFISHLQGRRLSRGELQQEQILSAIARKSPSFVIERLLEPLQKPAGFRETERAMKPLVPYFPRFTPTQAREFADLAIKNYSIWDAELCREEYLPKFLRAQKGKISKDRYRALKYQVQNRKRYEPTAA